MLSADHRVSICIYRVAEGGEFHYGSEGVHFIEQKDCTAWLDHEMQGVYERFLIKNLIR